jgi:hypothetical protein
MDGIVPEGDLRSPEKFECEEFHGEWNYVIRSRMEQR